MTLYVLKPKVEDKKRRAKLEQLPHSLVACYSISISYTGTCNMEYSQIITSDLH